MKTEIDISGHFNQPNLNTLLAMGGGLKRVAVITKKEKVKLWEAVEAKERKRKKRRSSGAILARLFAIMCCYLLGELPNSVTHIVIDHDLPGHEGAIQSYILNRLNHEGVDTSLFDLSFDLVGKGAAHDIADQVAKGKRDPDIVLSAKDFERFY